MNWDEVLKYSSKYAVVLGAIRFAFRLGVTTVIEVSETIKAEKDCIVSA